MLATTEPLDALVSVWDQANTGPGHTPIGSGVFIASRYVLTARHVVTAAHGKVWLGGVKDKHDLIPVNTVHCPTESHIDIALLELAMPNARQAWLQVDTRKRDFKRRKICLYGIFPYEKESSEKLECTITAYEETPGYYLTDYGHPMGYSGGAATIDGVIVGVISTRVRGENQGGIIPVSAVGEWLQEVAELRSSLVRYGALEAPLTLTPHEEFTRKVRAEIHGLLQQRSMEELCKAIGQHADSQAAAQVLVPLQPASLLESFECLRSATESCVQQSMQQYPERIEQIKKVAEEIFGWLVVLAVDRERVHDAGLTFDPWQGGFEVRIPLVSEAGIEVFVASLGGREARFKLTRDPYQGPRVAGKDSFPVDDLEIGMGQTDPLQETLKRIYVAVMETEGPPPRFGERELNRLRATLQERERRRRNKRYHYITVPPEPASSPLANPGLLTRLLERLPLLRVMYLGGAQGEDLLVLDEDELWASIVAFLQMLEGIP